MWILLAFVAIPVVEIALFILVGGWIGVLPTLGLVLLAAVAGVALIRRHGMRTLSSVQAAVQRGEDPGPAIFGAALALVAAGLFITPGFLTDALAILLLVPGFRNLVYARAQRRFKLTAAAAMAQASASARRPADFAGGVEIEGEFEEITPDKRPTHPPSGWTRH